MSELEYGRGKERIVSYTKVSKDKKPLLKYLGNGILVGFGIMFIGFISLIVLSFYELCFWYGLGVVFVGMLVVVIHGSIYDLNGGYEAEKNNRVKHVKEREFIDLLDSKSGNIRRLFVKGRVRT